jgi:hypothetical protein
MVSPQFNRASVNAVFEQAQVELGAFARDSKVIGQAAIAMTDA